MPYVIRAFRKKGITSDFISTPTDIKPYTGAPPIMGGGVLILGIFLGAILWCNLNQYVVALLLIMLSFGIIGAVDDVAKVLNKRHVESGRKERKLYSEKQMVSVESGDWLLNLVFLC